MFTLNCAGRLLILQKPVVMGIINATPDSFYKESRIQNLDNILFTAEKMLKDGATILDIGGQSTKPNSIRISEEDELKRVIHVIEKLHHTFPEAYISIDTYYAKVAKAAIISGANMVNDVSGGNMDMNMLATVAGLNVPFICMHMQGNPTFMQQNPHYENVVEDVLQFFIQQTEKCKQAGIKDVIIDVGFGFGKTLEHNYSLLKNLSIFKIIQKPILVGVSRKSMIYKILETSPQHALNGTTVLNTIALQNGASILRVHDVKEASETITLMQQLL
ncbi:MAG: dihydropteroate synthase [Chitinophagaceae bacterium]